MKEIKLSDGRIAVIKEGKGKDLFFAQRHASDPSDIIKLLMVRLTEIDSKPITEEDLDEMPIKDLMILMREFTELHSPLFQETPSSRS
jgi:plasmid maintenance system killer protein